MIQHCKKCEADTVHYDVSMKCKPCVSLQGLKYRETHERQQGKPPEAVRPGVHHEGTLHGKIHGGQGAVIMSVRRGCSMSW